MAKPILIVTTERNNVSKPVIQSLRDKKQNVIVVHTDRVCDQSDFFEFSTAQNKLLLCVGDKQTDLRNIGSAWYWRAVTLYATKDMQAKIDVEREMHHTLRGIWYSIEDSRWLNAPRRIRETQSKLMQLKYAQDVGLAIIPTVATNKFKSISEHFPKKFIVKMPGLGAINRYEESRALYTTVISQKDYVKYMNVSPFPGMYQPFLSKKKEWRVTVVGEKVFSAAIYTDKHSKVDWRLHSHDKKAVQFVAEDFPAETAEKCKKLLQNLGLRYGAFDFIETEDDKLYFVEVNTNGQFLWLEKELGFPISDAIADELISIANAKRS